MTSEQPEQLESQTNQLQEEYTFLIKEIVIQTRSHYGRLKKLVCAAEKNLMLQFQRSSANDWKGPLSDMGSKIAKDLQDEGLTKIQIYNALKYLQPEHRHSYGQGLNAGNLPISDSDFEELEHSVFEQVDTFAHRVLTDMQLYKLSVAERMQVMEEEINNNKSRKTVANDRIKHLYELAEDWKMLLFNIKKVSKQLPSGEFRGQSETYTFLEEWERQQEIITNMIKDLKQQVYNFKPDTEHDKKAIQEFEHFMESTFIPYAKIAIELCEGIKVIMRNITDEKYSDTNSHWMRNAEEKFLAYGNHGSGEVNAVLTNKVILKLGKDVEDEFGDVHKAIPTIVKVNVKRETTREQIGDTTTFEMNGHFDCPNCNRSFPISDEQRDLIAGDLFHQAKTTLLANGLSNAIDTLADNVVYEYVKDPRLWLKERYGNKYTDEQIEKAKIVETEEKIKDVDIDPKDITEKRHGMTRNAATRRLEKAQHFSDNS